MDYLVVPMAVRARLGENGSEGLVDMFSAYQQFSTDRYERRLIQMEASLRQEFRDGLTAIRVEMAEITPFASLGSARARLRALIDSVDSGSASADKARRSGKCMRASRRFEENRMGSGVGSY